MKNAIILQRIMLLFLISCSSDDAILFKNLPYRIVNVDLMDYKITQIDFDKKNNVWIGTIGKGLIKYNPIGWNSYNSANSSLPNDTINDVFVDNKDNIWVATNNGLAKFSVLSTWTIFNQQNSPFALRKITAVATDTLDNIWVASGDASRGGLYLYNGTSWTEFTSKNSELPVGAILNIRVDKNNVKWLSVENNLVKVEGSAITVYNNLNSPLGEGVIEDITLTQNQELLLGINHQTDELPSISKPSVVLYNNTTFEINNPINTIGTYVGFVRSVATDTNGNIWAATVSGQSLNVYKLGIWYVNNTDFARSIINDIAIDNRNRVWLATNKGIMVIIN